MNDGDIETEFPLGVFPSPDAGMPTGKLVAFSIFNKLFNQKIVSFPRSGVGMQPKTLQRPLTKKSPNKLLWEEAVTQ